MLRTSIEPRVIKPKTAKSIISVPGRELALLFFSIRELNASLRDLPQGDRISWCYNGCTSSGDSDYPLSDFWTPIGQRPGEVTVEALFNGGPYATAFEPRFSSSTGNSGTSDGTNESGTGSASEPHSSSSTGDSSTNKAGTGANRPLEQSLLYKETGNWNIPLDIAERWSRTRPQGNGVT